MADEQDQAPVQKMTISRGLTRMKTITAQLNGITNDIRSFGAWVDKERHPLGDTSGPKDDQALKRNHREAKAKIDSLWQQFHDLTKQFVALQTAINRANDTTYLTVGGRTMTISEAKVIESRIIGNPKKGVTGPARDLVAANQYAVTHATRAVQNYNSQYNNISDEGVKKTLLADVLYLVDQDKAREYNDFINTFLVEFNATLNEVNAVTEITL